MVSTKVARVKMWDRQVGALSLDESSGLCAFQYDPDWIKTGIELSPIHLPLANTIYQFPGLARPTYKGLPGAFADTLPDDFGHAVINAWLARQGRDKDSFTSLERLLYSGSRGMGALEYSPSLNGDLKASSTIELTSLIEMAQSILDKRGNLHEVIADEERAEALSAILQVGTSAGGARPKAVIGINKARSEIRSGQVDLPKGFEHYLLKFDGVVEHAKSRETFGDPQGYGRMEYAYYLMAKDAGLNMAPCELLLDGERAHFMTKRFDRTGNKKVHYQSLCAMDHADFKRPGQYSYEELFSLMRRLRLTRAEALEMYRRMVFNIVARNHDDHTKNFGFVLNTHNQWQLAPAFDIAYSYKPGSEWVNSHQLTVNGKREGFVREDVLGLLPKMHKETGRIVDEVIEVVSQWPRYAKEAGVFRSFEEEIQSNHRLNI